MFFSTRTKVGARRSPGRLMPLPHCGGARRLIAMITDGLVVRRILGPPRAAQHSPADRSRQSASRARVRLVVHDASELRTSKEAQFGGAVPRAAKPAPPNQRLRPARRGSRGGAEQLDVRPRDRIHSSGGSRPPGEAARTGPNRPNRYPLPGVIRCRVAPGDRSPRALSRSGLGDFHHPALPLMRLVATTPRSARGSEVWARGSAPGASRTLPTSDAIGGFDGEAT